MSGINTPMKELSLEFSFTESTKEEQTDEKMNVDENMLPKCTSDAEIQPKRALVFDDVPELSEDEEVDQNSNINLPPPELSEEEMEIEDKENLKPADLPQPKEKILIKEPDFPAPAIEVPEEPKESRILSPKKGVKVNTAHTPSYMRGTASSSAKTPKKGGEKVPEEKKREMPKPGFSTKFSKPTTKKYGIAASLCKKEATKPVVSKAASGQSSSSRFGFQPPKKLASRPATAPSKPVAPKPTAMKSKTETAARGRPTVATKTTTKSKTVTAPKRPVSARPAFGSSAKPAKPVVSSRPASAKPTVDRAKSTLTSRVGTGSAPKPSTMSAKSSIPPRPASAKPRPATTSTSASRFGAVAKTGVSKTERKPGAPKKEEAKKVVQPTSSKVKPGVVQPKVVSRFGQASASSKKEVQKVKPASSTAPGKSTAATIPKPKIPSSTMEKSEKSKPLTAKAVEVTERLLSKTPKTPRDKPAESKTPASSSASMKAKTPVRPKTPVAKTPAKTPGKMSSKTPTGATGKSAKKEEAKKRRRTRYSITQEATEKMSEAFSKCAKNRVEANESLFKDLNEDDQNDAESNLVVQAIENLIQSAKEQNLPSHNLLDLLTGMRDDLGEDIAMVTCYWAAKIDVLMKLGSKACEIKEELETATKSNPIPASDFAKLKKETLEKMSEPGFDERGATPDPEATIPLEDDEMLELSIVNMPPFEEPAPAPTVSVEAPTPEPESFVEPMSTEQTLANLTEMNNKQDATLLRFVVRKTKCKDLSKLIVTPVRRSKRIANKTPGKTPGTPTTRTPRAELDITDLKELHNNTEIGFLENPKLNLDSVLE
ncbi:Oidioi.mRNA.OKI2018_I69.PAR.g10091.t1.cds [Oikopleura dioica]|uniref:Oidioi.mRNA.OKI2018_I69.PAR.g10091.t1.cds n=1 Tax=Oikopleura dioica TaxID=34765 RepID=A0ABN7RSC5_OIKDI|nr:Oidioi.mRNA.OKI2018_I69.PAR.g10091.t1.cds [Oikopleura dioica]